MKIAANGKKLSMMNTETILRLTKSEKGKKRAKALKEAQKRGLVIE
jgi:hypothetical protein